MFYFDGRPDDDRQPEAVGYYIVVVCSRKAFILIFLLFSKKKDCFNYIVFISILAVTTF